MKTRIGVRTQFAGLHQWVDVPKGQVNSFLQYPHRHVFQIEALFNVTHSDRQIEFFDAQLHINDIVNKIYGKDDIKDLGSRSCEIIAREIYGAMSDPFRGALVWIKVQEDTENYAVIQI